MTPEVDEALADFFRTVWGASGIGSDVAAARAATAAANPSDPGETVPEFVFLLNQKVIGYLGAVPVSFWNGQTETQTYWLKGFMVHPEHRNGPVGFNLLKEALKVIGPSGAIAAAPAARRLFTALGFVECGAIPNYVSVLRPSRFMSLVDVGTVARRLPKIGVFAFELAQKLGVMKVAGILVQLAQKMWQGAFGLSNASSRLQLDAVLPASDEINALWLTARKDIKAAAVRDFAFLSWRYQPAPGGLYEAASVRDNNGQLIAIAIVRKPAAASDERLRGVKLAVLADILFAPADVRAGLMALRGAERIALRMGADALLCSASAPILQNLLRRRAYFRIPANVYFLARDPLGALGLPSVVGDWWLTRGDGRADDAF